MRSPDTLRPVLAVTMGDVNGIGPEILAKALAEDLPWKTCAPVVFGSPQALEDARRFAPKCPAAVPVSSVAEALSVTNGVPVLSCGNGGPAPAPGVLDPAAGAAAVVWIEHAVRAALSGEVGGMVTCPISKEAILRAGCPHTGHTSLIAAMTNSPDYRMCLFTEKLRIIHITAHLSMHDAVAAVKKDRILKSILLADAALRRLGMTAPRIAVAALNPHAGEAGAFGDEEIHEIAPAVREAAESGVDASGPHPPDTVFRRAYYGEFDAVIAMYHDQGHIPLKLVAMDEGVNVTLGTPIVRTSVDHGTAFDIAGTGHARHESLLSTITMASLLARKGFAS